MRRVGKVFSGRDTPLFPIMMVQAQQEHGEDEAVNKEMNDSLVRTATTTSSLEAEFENVSKTSNDSLLAGVNTPQSDEDRSKLNELMEFCSKLQQRVLDLENTKTAQAQEITSLKLKVKKLEKKGGLRTHKLKRLYKVGRSARVISSDEASLGNQEDASKQERKIDNIDKDEYWFMKLREALKSAKVQEKANVVKEPSESITTTKTLTTTASITIIAVKVQDKGKGIMVEEPVKIKKKDQISLDEELAFKLQAKEEKEERLVREKAQREEEANILSWDNVQAMIDVDYQMAQQQMQAEEQEELSIEEKSKLFVQLLEARKKHFAAMICTTLRSNKETLCSNKSSRK
ncbi:hypothetical protein Tco_0709821 [Tanacetum coccineum]